VALFLRKKGLLKVWPYLVVSKIHNKRIFIVIIIIILLLSSLFFYYCYYHLLLFHYYEYSFVIINIFIIMNILL